jgi:YidC/Oxa1 family membrane protein insertase
MKFAQASKLLVLVAVCDAFAPTKFGAPRSTARSLSIDPSILHHLPNQVQSLQDAFSSMSLSAGPDTSGLMNAMMSSSEPSSAIDMAGVVAQNAAPAADAVTEAAADGNGWFGFLVGPTEFLLQSIHSVLNGVGVTENAWGISIIVMTLVIKLLTFPLTQTQLQSTNKMQVSVVVI